MPVAGSRVVGVLAAIGLAACGGGVAISLPEGPGTPLRNPAERLANATARCAGVRTVAAESRVSGSVGRRRVRATLLIGVEHTGNARIEALAGPGAPVLVLTAQAEHATLVLPRDGQVLEDASVAAILDALVGVRIDAADLARALSGCFGAGDVPVGGRSYGGGMASFDLPGATTVWTRDSPEGPRTVAGRRGALTVAYERTARVGPSKVRFVVRHAQPPVETAADLTLALSRIELNDAIDPGAFVARVPRDAQPITLDELRRSGPLGATRP